MNVKVFYVYELWNPLNNQIFYVGKGTKYNNGYYRLSNHIKDARYAKSGKIKMSHKFRTILKILENKQKPEMKIVFESTDHNLIINKEKELIKHYGRRDNKTGILCNHTNGGEGALGIKHSEEWLINMRTNNIGGKIVSKPIYSICSKTFNIVYYDSAQSASIVLFGSKKHRSNISNVATKHKNRISNGYYWRFVSDYDPNENFAELNKLRDRSLASSKSITQFDIEGNVIKVWNSAAEICRYYGKNITTLFRHIKKQNIWNGFYWKYTN